MGAPFDRPERLSREIDVDPSSDREGHDQGRAHEEVRLHALVNARLEVAVSRQHARPDDVVLGESLFELSIQRARIADAGRATEPDELEAQAIEERLQARLGEVLAHDARAGRERGLHPGLDAEPAFDRLLRQETGRQHDGRVGGVGARSDGGDHDVPVGQLVAGRPRG